MVGTIICEVDTIICDIGTINVRFYLLEVYGTHMGTVELPLTKRAFLRVRYCLFLYFFFF
jgi:hypothetical protein